MPKMIRELQQSDIDYGLLYLGDLQGSLPGPSEPVTVIDSDGQEFRSTMHSAQPRIDGLTALHEKHGSAAGQVVSITVHPQEPRILRVHFISTPHTPPINVEDRDLSDEEIDQTLRANQLRIGIVPTDSQQAQVRQRRGQDRIRKLTVENYEERCAVCDVMDHVLLIASHVVGWAEAPEHRGNLSNVICLCRMHDALFEAGYWSLGSSLELLTKKSVTSKTIRQLLDGMASFHSPREFPPAPYFVKCHRERTGFKV